MMRSSIQRIKVHRKYGSLVMVVDNSHAVHSDEESTEPATYRKPIVQTKVSEPPRVSMEEDIWWQMNQDFALDSEDNEFYMPNKKAVATSSRPQVEKDSPLKPMFVVSDDEWMAINQDFARESSHVEPVALPKKPEPSVEEPYGDYGVWWE